MRADTKKRKNATQMLRATQEQEWWADQVVHVMLEGKRALDAAMLDVGRLVAETLMYMEREERSGPDYHPTSSGLRKWASQRGSIYVGDQKLPVEHPRLRGPEGEVGLRTYEQLKNRGGFSEELLSEVLRGMLLQLFYEMRGAVLRVYDLVDRHSVDSRCAIIPAHLCPRCFKHILPKHMVVQRVKPELRLLLGLLVQLVSQTGEFRWFPASLSPYWGPVRPFPRCRHRVFAQSVLHSSYTQLAKW